jgi:hypothetical protein
MAWLYLQENLNITIPSQRAIYSCTAMIPERSAPDSHPDHYEVKMNLLFRNKNSGGCA